MNAFTVVHRRPSFATAIAAGSVRPQQMLPPGSPLLSHTSPAIVPVAGATPSAPISGRFSFRGIGKSPRVNQSFGPAPVLHLGLPTSNSVVIHGPLEAMLPHLVE